MSLKRIIVTAGGFAWWQLSGGYDSPPGRLINARGRVIGVDPATTSPNIVVGIVTTPGELPIYLRPGESITLPEEVRQFYVFNPEATYALAIAAANGSGIEAQASVCLIVGGVDDLVAWRARANSTRPLPRAALILAQQIVLTGLAYLPLNGLEFARIRVLCLDAASKPIAAPAGLAGTIRFFNADLIPQTQAGVYDAGQYARLTEEANMPSNALADLTPDVAADFNFTATAMSLDYNVGASSYTLMNLSALAGLGVASVVLFVTGR